MSSLDDDLAAEWKRICDVMDEVGEERLPRRDRVFSAIWMLVCEVDNGGFTQYMYNDYGDNALLAVSGLREIGADELANICERFYALLPGGRPLPQREARDAQLDAAEETFGQDDFYARCHQLEREFYALEPDLWPKLWAFIASAPRD